MTSFLKKIISLLITVTLSTGCVSLRSCFENNFVNAPRESFVKLMVLTPQFISSGSGVIIRHVDNYNTIILTAGHMCDHNILEMKVLDLNENVYNAVGFVRSSLDDLCAVVVSDNIKAPDIKVTNPSIEIGEHIYNIAAPMGIHAPNMSLMFDGYYEGNVNLPEEKYALSLYSIPGKGGSSGSPIFNSNWEIIGIISRGVEEFSHIMMATSPERTKMFSDYVQSERFKADMMFAVSQHKKTVKDLIKNLTK